MALRSQRTNHVLHYEYTSTGENLPFLEEEYEIATENGVFQMNGRWSDNPIVLIFTSVYHFFVAGLGMMMYANKISKEINDDHYGQKRIISD